MTIKAIEKMLIDAHIDDASNEAMILCEEILGLSRANLIANKNKDFDSVELEMAVNRRLNHEPIQYIIGKWEFMGHMFWVTPDCLIPRLDTEIITSYAIEKMKKGGKFADLCTGSGCIAIFILASNKDVFGVAVELMEKAVNIAKKNAVLNSVADRMEIICADIKDDPLKEKYDLITANPPYVTLEEMSDLSPEVLKEPRVALTDEGDGLSLIKVVIDTGINHLKDDGEILVEIGYKQGNAVLEYAKSKSLFCEILKDYEHRDRVARIRLN